MFAQPRSAGSATWPARRATRGLPAGRAPERGERLPTTVHLQPGALCSSHPRSNPLIYTTSPPGATKHDECASPAGAAPRISTTPASLRAAAGRPEGASFFQGSAGPRSRASCRSRMPLAHQPAIPGRVRRGLGGGARARGEWAYLLVSANRPFAVRLSLEVFDPLQPKPRPKSQPGTEPPPT